MPHLPSLPEDSVLLDVFKAFPETAVPLMELTEVLMRGPSPLSVGEREFIAAYCSGLNACRYCTGVHSAVADEFGISEEALSGTLEDLGGAQVEERLKPILAYVRTLTLEPTRLTAADAQAVYDAGWDEKALYDAVMTCALFNLMNRMVEGLGITAPPGYFALARERLSGGGYRALVDMLAGETAS